jgi:hypothetical protein
MWPDLHPVYTASNGVVVYVSKGGKSRYNFKVQYQEPGKRVRTPKHIHLIIDLYMKRTGNKRLTMQLVDHIINEIILKVDSSTSNPPVLQVFSPTHVERFRELDVYGEYSAEFLLVITELIMIQERTNYPNGVLNLRLFQRFREEADIFSVVSAATFRGR